MRMIRFVQAVCLLFLVTLLVPGAAFAAETGAVDFRPVLQPMIEALGIVAAVTALPVMWYIVNWIRGILGLQAIQKDAALRVAIDAGLQKSVGKGIGQIKEAVAGLPMTVDTKNQVIQVAAEYARNTIADSLKAAKLDDPQKLADAIEARLGIMEMQTSTGQPSPALPNAAQPLTPPSA